MYLGVGDVWWIFDPRWFSELRGSLLRGVISGFPIAGIRATLAEDANCLENPSLVLNVRTAETFQDGDPYSHAPPFSHPPSCILTGWKGLEPCLRSPGTIQCWNDAI